MEKLFTHLLENYEACVAVILFVIGLCMLLFDRNLLKKVIGLDIMDTTKPLPLSSFLLIASITIFVIISILFVSKSTPAFFRFHN